MPSETLGLSNEDRVVRMSNIIRYLRYERRDVKRNVEGHMEE